MYDVRTIIETINRNGRQGPKDLKSNEVYEWVNRTLPIEYEEYFEILTKNAIPEEERYTNRNAFFLVDENNRFKLFKSNEEEIRKYLCYIIRENENITSGEIRKKFKYIYQEYTFVDLMDQKNLASPQDVIDQTIRNILVSNYERRNNRELFIRTESTPYRYRLTEKGFELAQEAEAKIEMTKIEEEMIEDQATTESRLELAKGLHIYTDEELALINEKNKSFDLYDEIGDVEHWKGRYPQDMKLKTTCLAKAHFLCEVDSNHLTFPTPYMPNFVVGHHLVPLGIQKNFPSVKLDCIQNLVSLCPNCHAKIHYGTREEKKQVFDFIVKKRENDLLQIGFTKEILKIIFDTYY